MLVAFHALLAAAPPDASSLADQIKSEWRAAKRGGGLATRRKRWERLRRNAAKLDLKTCTDTCDSAKNGKCEDGSKLIGHPESRNIVDIVCDYGTDCSDCGPLPMRRPPATLQQSMASAPIFPYDGAKWFRSGSSASVKLLRKHKVRVSAAWTRTQPPFIMPFTDPKEDIDVSRAMASPTRAVEPVYNLYVHRLCAECCAKGGLMLDVGANFGYYSLLAAKLGCRVVAWEPVPVFRAFVETALRLNNLTHRVHLRAAVVSDVAGQRINVTVPEKGIWGTASVGGMNVDPSIPSPKYQVTAISETLDSVVRETPCFLKLDVEGYEPSVLKGAASFLKKHAPAAILTEYTPGVMERHRQWSRLPEYPASLRAFKSAGYALWHLVGTGKNSERVVDVKWASAPLPPLAEITERTVRAEETNARNMVADNGRATAGFSVPWDLHPKSLHAEFSHNTDLLLTLNGSAIRRKRVVGISEHSDMGLGGGLCVHVLRDGTALEMIGRLCLSEGRNESIQKAIEMAEAPRPLKPRHAWHSYVSREGKKWRLDGPMRTSRRRMRRNNADGEPSSLLQRLARGRGGGRGRGKRKGRGSLRNLKDAVRAGAP